MALDHARLRGIEEQQLTRRSHPSSPPWWSWGIYADGTGIQFGVTWDDTLKKNERFCNFAQDVAQAILGESWKVGFGKWGAAIWEDDNPGRTIEEFQEAAEKVRKHPSWLAFVGVTHVFTFGE